MFGLLMAEEIPAVVADQVGKALIVAEQLAAAGLRWSCGSEEVAGGHRAA